MYAWLRRYFLLGNGDGAAAGAPAVEAKAERSPELLSGAWLPRRDALNSAFDRWVFESENYPGSDINPTEQDILDALGELTHSAEPVDLVPRMPGVIPHLLRSIRAGDFSAAHLAKEISQDVVLVAEVIRLVNSSLYNPATAITSVEHAVLVLGQAGLRQLVTCMAFRPIIDVNSGYFVKLAAPRVWAQSEQCARANRLLAGGYRVDPFHAFLAGLAHKVGLIVSLRIIDQVAQGKRLLGSTPYLAGLAEYSSMLSASVASEWGFPATVGRAIEEQGAAATDAALSALGRTLALGDYLSKLEILARERRIGGDSDEFLDDLPPAALDCYRELCGPEHS